MENITGVNPSKYIISDEQKPGTSGIKDNRRKNKKRKIATSDLSQKYNVPITQYYESISSDSDDEDEIEEVEVTDSNIPEETIKTSKPPPIVLYSFLNEHSRSINNIKKELTANITIKNLGNRLLLHTENKHDYNKIKEIISKANMEFHTYTPKEEQEIKLVIKNLPPNITCDEIKEDLIQKNVPVIKIVQMTKKVNENHSTPLPLYVVIISNKMKVKDIIEIKHVCHCIIQWERYKNKNRVVQCYKCQSFDHIARNCYKNPKCSICAGPHETNSCDNKDNLKCTNCQNPHAANDKQCPTYIKRLTRKVIKEQKAKDKTEEKKQRKNEFVYEQKEFPQMRNREQDIQVNNENRQPTSPTTRPQTTKGPGQESISDMFKSIKSLFESFNISRIIQKIKATVTLMQLAPDNMTKISVLFDALIDFFD